MELLKSKLSLIATIAVILIAGAGGYYLIRMKQGPYPAASFIAVQYKWGEGKVLENSYDSETGIYQYLDQKDSLITKNIKLSANNVIFLHSRANEAGFWELPDVIGSPVVAKAATDYRFELILKYEQKTKKIICFPNDPYDMASTNAALKIVAAIEQLLKEREGLGGF